MLNKILVPLDGSALAEGVLPHALAMSRAFDAQVTLLHVVDQGVAIGETSVDPLAWHMLKAEGQSYLQQIGAAWSAADAPVELALLEGLAAERILGYAGEQGADLILLSSHGRSGLSEWNVSAVGQKLIMRAFRSVMIVRATSAAPAEPLQPARYERILVPLDGSRRAEGVLPVLQRLVEADGAEVTLAHIIHAPVLFRQPPAHEDIALLDEYVQRTLRDATEYLDQLCERLGPNTKAHIEVSESPFDALLRLGETTRADLVLFSAHGRTAHYHPYGNLVTSFIQYSGTPLLIYQDMIQDPLRPSTAETTAETAGRAPGRMAADMPV